MKHGFIKVAAISPKIKVADPAYNAGVIVEKMKEAYEKGAKILVFPELCITGYTCGDLFLQEILLEEAKRQLSVIAEATQDMDALVMVGLPVEREGRLYNVAAVLHQGSVLGMVPKSNLPMYGEFYEGRHFTEGNTVPVSYDFEGEEVPFGRNLLFECNSMPGLVIGCELCEDLWVAGSPFHNPCPYGSYSDR